jgi:hypothetical protein
MARIAYTRANMKGREWFKVGVCGPDDCRKLERWLKKLTGDFMVKRSPSRIKWMGKRQDNDLQKLVVLLAEDEDFLLLKLSGDFTKHELYSEAKMTRDHHLQPMSF